MSNKNTHIWGEKQKHRKYRGFWPSSGHAGIIGPPYACPCQAQDDSDVKMARVISNQLTNVLSTRVACTASLSAPGLLQYFRWILMEGSVAILIVLFCLNFVAISSFCRGFVVISSLFVMISSFCRYVVVISSLFVIISSFGRYVVVIISS